MPVPTILDRLNAQIEMLPDLNDGDILIVKGPEHMTRSSRDELKQALHYVLRSQGRSNALIIVPGGYEFAKANDDVLAAVGLQRLPENRGLTDEDLARAGVERVGGDVCAESI